MPGVSSRLARFFLRRANFVNPPGIPLEVLRRRADSGGRLLRPPRGTRVERVRAGGVPAEWLIPPGAIEDAALLYIHGGAWVFCSPDTHRALVRRLAQAGKLRALSIAYRLAPENPFPAALEDCLEAYHWLLDNGYAADRIVIGGDSAGGNLALATLLALRDAGDPLPAAAVCLSPATDLAWTGDSICTRAAVDPILGRLGTLNVPRNYIGDRDPTDPLISPLYGDLHGIPPVLIHVGEDEVLLDDATRFVRRARAAGVDAQVVVWKGMWHVFQAFAVLVPESRQSIEQIGRFIQSSLEKAPIPTFPS